MLRTWDIFDTLVARWCIHPQGVFYIIEKRFNLKGFASARIFAEQAVIQECHAYTIDDIYIKLCEKSNLTEKDANKLKRIECNLEIEQAIPIAENINQVRAGDVLISDMYLPVYVIEAILDKVGLRVPVEIVITNDGKRSGRIWKEMKDQNVRLSHRGDNQLSDIRNPKVCGFEAMITPESTMTDIEKTLLEKERDFACYMRALRMKNPFTDAIRKKYWSLFVLNVGILMAFAKKIHAVQKMMEIDYLGFCGRDTYFLHKIYKKYLEKTGEDIRNVKSEYLYYSRALCVNSTKALGEYLAYKTKGKKALLIDLRGSGSHLTRLRENAGLNVNILLCIWLGWDVAKNFYKDDRDLSFVSYKDAGGGDCEKSLNLYLMENGPKSEDAPVWDDSLELMNRAPHNSPIGMDIIHIGEKIVPSIIFSEIDDTEYFEVLERCAEVVLREPAHFPENDEALDSLIVVMLSGFYKQKGIVFHEKQMMETVVNSIAFGRLM